VGLERGPLNLVGAIEELLEIKSSDSGLENRDYGPRDSSHLQRGTPYPQQLALTSSTSGGRSVGIVRSRTQAMEFSFLILYYIILGEHGSVVVKALCYKPEGRGFDIRWGEWIFSV
jgi:hypothetical protein